MTKIQHFPLQGSSQSKAGAFDVEGQAPHGLSSGTVRKPLRSRVESAIMKTTVHITTESCLSGGM